MKSRIEQLPEKKLVGLNLSMSFASNKTVELWRSFMPRRKEIPNNVSSDLLSMQIYRTSQDFANFDVHAEFVKWAAVEVTDFTKVPEGMQTFLLPAGTYAVFSYKGLPSEGANAFRYIVGTWLPSSEFQLDNRPHFELLGENYKNNDPDSEEEIWIPVRARQ